ncbi:hypothetical protein A5714_10120 [Mycobacterium sp. E2462]|uniref:PE domain-containing protein n=1 Tax=Mycobacterium sp. E2462 TaxID=1834133 RepID=UPI0007FEE0FD|nr:PE domain-containing protein [Mycobacterium sp. E2462]OBI17876.1 hypothetical protein A5714_10120 [Mycobacterium sp. E2462]
MESMSHDPVAGTIGVQLVDVAARGLAAGAAAAPAVTALVPAGVDEVSAQAAIAFAEDGAALLAAHAAAQEELARAGVTLTDIARRYAEVDGEAAGTLEVAGAQFVGKPFAAGAGGGLARGGALPGAGGSAARTPLLTSLLESTPASPVVPPPTPTAGVPAAGLPGVVNAASTALGAGAGPLSSLSSLAQGASAGGAAGPGLASSLTDTSRGDDTDREAGPRDGERLI